MKTTNQMSITELGQWVVHRAEHYFNGSVFDRIIDTYPMGEHEARYGIHGQRHWARVLSNSCKLLYEMMQRGDLEEVTEVMAYSVVMFSLFHDSKRETNGVCMRHGDDGASFYKECIGDMIVRHPETYTQEDHESLLRAMRDHCRVEFPEEYKQAGERPTVLMKICFDSDRLDLPRVGIIPDPDRMFTEVGKVLAIGMQEPQATFSGADGCNENSNKGE
jgi:uncharacterized protein